MFFFSGEKQLSQGRSNDTVTFTREKHTLLQLPVYCTRGRGDMRHSPIT